MSKQIGILSTIGTALLVALTPALHSLQVIASVYHH